MLEEFGILMLKPCGRALSALPSSLLAPQVKYELPAINLPVIFPSCETVRCCFLFSPEAQTKKTPKKTCEAQQFESGLRKSLIPVGRLGARL